MIELQATKLLRNAAVGLSNLLWRFDNSIISAVKNPMTYIGLLLILTLFIFLLKRLNRRIHRN